MSSISDFISSLDLYDYIILGAVLAIGLLQVIIEFSLLNFVPFLTYLLFYVFVLISGGKPRDATYVLTPLVIVTLLNIIFGILVNMS